MFKIKVYKTSKNLRKCKDEDNVTINCRELKRIFLESLDIIFCHHNALGQNFGITKLIYFMDLIIPTGCIYSTSFWIYYDPSDMQSDYCMCTRYNISCEHEFINRCWIKDCELEEILNFAPNFEGLICPTEVTFLTAVAGSHMDILLNFNVKEKNATGKLYSNITIVLRFYIICEFIPPPKETIYVFDPSPVVHPYYGCLLKEELFKMYKYFYKLLVVPTDLLQNFTLYRAHSYVDFIPSTDYDIETPPLFSIPNTPLTQIDYDMINDICNSLLNETENTYIKNIILDVQTKANYECATRNATN